MIVRRNIAIVASLLLALAAWGYWCAARVTISPAVARRTTLRWLGPVPAHTTVTWVGWSLTWVGYGGYLHRDWELQRFACSPGPLRCKTSYVYTVFVNGQTGHVDHAMIGAAPGTWPLAVTRHLGGV